MADEISITSKTIVIQIDFSIKEKGHIIEVMGHFCRKIQLRRRRQR
jgi:hypothetical protein